MKSLILLAGLATQLAFADIVYMKEGPTGKTIELQGDGPTITLNDQNNGLWSIYPDISADGSEFIYSEGLGPSDLNLTYYNRLKGLTQRFIHPIKGMLLHPQFAKSGRLIFYSAPGPRGKNTIYYFNRAAEVSRQGLGMNEYSLENARPLDASEESYFPRPSSDGSFVVYQRNGAKKEIVLFDLLENKKKVLAEGMSPALSFDERLIAYTARDEKGWNIHVIDRSTGKSTQLTFEPKDEMAPSFMPDNTLVFASNKSGNFHLYKLVDGAWKLVVGASLADVDFYSPQYSGEKHFLQNERAPFLGNPRSSFGTVSHEGKVYMAGGHQGAEHTYPPESFTDNFLVYNIALNAWSELAPRPVKAHGYQLAAMGNYIYAFGGFAYSEVHKPRWKSLNQIDRYDIKSNKWETIGRLLQPRSSNVAVTIGEKVYLAGGWNSTPKFENDMDGMFHDTVEVFDLRSETLNLASFTLPSPKRRALTGVELKGQIVLVGGLGEGASHFELLNKVTVIDPINGNSKELTPLPFATFAPAAEVLGDELFVFGGMFKTGPMNYEYVSHVYGMDLSQKVWRHTGRYLKETKGFSQVFKLDARTLGILGGHHYFEGHDSPVTTFETFTK